MLTAFHGYLAVMLLYILIVWKSPAILFGAQFTLGAVFRSDVDSIPINLAWFGAILTLGFMLRRNNITLDRFYLSTGKVSNLRKWAFLGLFVLALFLWMQAAGVTGWESLKRTATSGTYANAIGGVMTLFFGFSIAVLMFYRAGQPKWLLWLCLSVFAFMLVKAFLGSNRGTAVIPLVFVLFARFALLRRTTQLPNYFVLSTTVGGFVLMFLATVTAQRAGIRSAEGIQRFSEQLTGALGNGYSPLRDQYIMAHIEAFGPILPSSTLLAPLYAFIPRFLWEDKPDVGVGRIIGSEVFGTRGIDERGAGIPISVPAELEAIIGAGGYGIGLFVVLLVVVVLGLKAKKYPALIVPLGLVAPNLMGSDLGRLAVQFILLSVSIIAFQRFLNVRIRYNNGQQIVRPRAFQAYSRQLA